MQKSLTNKTINKLKYDLVRDGLISYDSLSKAEDIAVSSGENLAQVFIHQNLISEQDLLGFIEAKLHIPYINLDDYIIDKSCLVFIPYQEAKNHKIIPLFKIEDTITIAMADPLDLFLLNSLIKSVNCKIEPVICSERNVLDAIEKHYLQEKSIYSDNDLQIFDWRKELSSENSDKMQRIIQAIIYQALIEEVYEIFLESIPNGINVKFKKDKEISNKGIIPVLLVPLCISNLKSMANLNPAVSEIPQTGKLILALQQIYNNPTVPDKIIASISTFPTINGERIVLKLYKPPKKIDELSINNHELDLLKLCLTKSGLIIVAGQDKTLNISVIYSILSSLDSINKNIITIESVIKQELLGINQCELNEKVGFNFDKAARFIEFQCPDGIYLEDFLSGIDLTISLAQTDKLVLVELIADSPKSLHNKLENYEIIKKYISCIVFVDNADKISVLNGDIN